MLYPTYGYCSDVVLWKHFISNICSMWLSITNLALIGKYLWNDKLRFDSPVPIKTMLNELVILKKTLTNSMFDNLVTFITYLSNLAAWLCYFNGVGYHRKIYSAQSNLNTLNFPHIFPSSG